MNRAFTAATVACVLVASGCKKGKDVDPLPPDDSPVVHSALTSSPPKGCGGGFFSSHYRDAFKTLREAEEYKSGTRDYYVRELSDRRNEYLLAGISPSFRKDWLSSHKIAEKDYPCLVPVFDEIGAAAKRTLPRFRPLGYKNHNSDEESLMIEVVKEKVPDAEIMGMGVKQANWDIEKLNNGTPSVRYKYGMAWVKSATWDDGFCRILFVNVVQDYSGGGSYADTRANYISMQPAGCL